MRNNTGSSHIQQDMLQRSQERVRPVDIWKICSLKIFHRLRVAQSDGLGTSCNPTKLAHEAILKLDQWSHAGKTSALFTLMKAYSLSATVGWKMLPRGRRSWQEPVSSFLRQERGTGNDRGAGSALSSPLFNASFIHLQDLSIPTLYQPHFKNRHTLHSSIAHFIHTHAQRQECSS